MGAVHGLCISRSAPIHADGKTSDATPLAGGGPTGEVGGFQSFMRSLMPSGDGRNIGRPSGNMQKEKKFKEGFDVGKQLGAGAMSNVHECTHKATQTKYAVKCVFRTQLGKEEEAAVKNEISILMLLDHPLVNKLHWCFTAPRMYYMVLEVLSGGELFDRIVQRRTFGEAEARHATEQILEALRYTHKMKVVHRDLKPENLLLTSADDDADVKLADFGFAKNLSKATDGRCTTCCGSPGYVAPEVIMGMAYDTSADMWGLGVVLFILLGGFNPFYSDDINEVYRRTKGARYDLTEPHWAHVSEQAKDLISKLLVVDVKKRLTAEETHEHPWFALELQSGGASNMERLRLFNAKHKLRGAIRTLIMGRALNKLFSDDDATEMEEQQETPQGTGPEEEGAEGEGEGEEGRVGIVMSVEGCEKGTTMTSVEGSKDKDKSEGAALA